MINYKTIIENLDPNRKIFNEFIFRDKENKLYKLDKENNPIYLKEDLDYDKYLFQTCSSIDSKNEYLNICSNIFFDLVNKYDSAGIKDIMVKINESNNITDFLQITKKNITNIDFNSVLLLLNKLGFQTELYFDNIIERKILKVQNTINWIETKDEELKKILYKNQTFIEYLQLLVDYINSNPSILNKDWTNKESHIYKIKQLESFLRTNYDEIDIYLNILKKNNLYENNLKDIISNENDYKFSYQIGRYFDIFLQKYKKYVKGLDLFNPDEKISADTIYGNYYDSINNIYKKELELTNKLKPILKFLLLNPKLLDYSNETIKNQYTDLDKEVLDFIKLKNKLKILYDNFEKNKYN